MEITVKNNRHSIRCLKAIEQYVGGRPKLAEKIGASTAALARWTHEQSIAKGAILDLVAAGDNKFSAEELLGKFDNNESTTM